MMQTRVHYHYNKTSRLQDASMSHFMEFDIISEPCIADANSESSIKYRLQREFGLPSRHAEMCASKTTGIFADLLTYKESGGESSFQAPLVLLSVDFADFHSQAFFHLGNYNLPSGYPGSLRHPTRSTVTGELPPWVTLGPNAMGRFLCNLPGVVDVSNGKFTLLKFPSAEALHEARAAIQNIPQFQRIGPRAAKSMQIKPQQELVSVFVFNFKRCESWEYRNFHQTE